MRSTALLLSGSHVNEPGELHSIFLILLEQTASYVYL